MTNRSKIKTGVTLKRTRKNVFQIAYDNEIVTVNLTIIRGRNDRSAYPLGFKCIDQDYFSIIHSGQGDALDFEEDRLGTIVWAHRADPLTNKQKEIGASAIFSILDALVPAETDNLRRF